MDKAELQKLWEDPANWRLLSYRCAADPRIIVPKRQRRGWTINAAHGWRAIFILTGAIIVALSGPALLVATEGLHFNSNAAFQAIFASAALLIVFRAFVVRHLRK